MDYSYRQMPYRPLGHSGLKVSNVGLGTWKFGYPHKQDGSRVDPRTAFAIFDRALELGVTFWDTANRYNQGSGNSERVIGQWFAAHPSSRRDVVLATKMAGEMDGTTPNHAGLSRINILESVYASLERLKTDSIDLLYFHNAGDPDTPPEESLEAVEDLVRQDLVRYFALSNYTAGQLAQMVQLSEGISRRCRPIAVQNQFDLLSGENSRYPGVFAWCAEHGVSFVAWSPLAGGLLTGRYNQPQLAGAGDRLVDEGRLEGIPASQFEKVRELSRLAEELELSLSQLVLAYMLTLPGGGPVIPASSSVAQLEDNAQAGRVVLSGETLQRVAKIING